VLPPPPPNEPRTPPELPPLLELPEDPPTEPKLPPGLGEGESFERDGRTPGDGEESRVRDGAVASREPVAGAGCGSPPARGARPEAPPADPLGGVMMLSHAVRASRGLEEVSVEVLSSAPPVADATAPAVLAGRGHAPAGAEEGAGERAPRVGWFTKRPPSGS
jgi:hypothetical protein